MRFILEIQDENHTTMVGEVSSILDGTLYFVDAKTDRKHMVSASRVRSLLPYFSDDHLRD